MRKATTGHTGDLVALFAVYTLAYGLMLLNHGIYWDDWVWFDLRPDLIRSSMSQLGYPFLANIHLLLQKGGIFAYRLLTFICYLAAAIALYATLARIPTISRTQRLFIALIFAIYPVNSARILIATVHYAIAYAGFFLACYAFVCYRQSHSRASAIAAWMLFFASTYLVNSLLVFYGLLPIYLLYNGIRERASLPKWRRLIGETWPFLVLPALVFFVKQQWGKPYGLYDGYNTISLSNLLIPWSKIDEAVRGTLFEPIRMAILSAQSTGWLIGVAVAVALGIALWGGVVTRIRNEDVGTARPSYVSLLGNILLAVAMLILAIFPYLLVGKMPAVYSWETRHQMLVPLGAAWLIVFTAEAAKRLVRLPLTPVLSIVGGIFVAGNLHDDISYIGDAFKQDSFMASAAHNRELQEGRGLVYLMRDASTDLNWSGRCLSFYEYAGMFNQIFHEQNRLPIGSCELGAYDVIRHGFTASYHLSDVTPGLPTREVIIEHAGYPLGINETLRLLKQKYLEPQHFDQNLRNIVSVRVVPYLVPR